MRQHRKQGKSIFQFIFAAMLIVLGIEVALLIGTLYFGNVGMQMNRNAIEDFEETGGKPSELSAEYAGRNPESFIPGRNDQYCCRESDCSGEYQCRGIGK